MSRVEIVKIKCHEESDEVGSDDIYLAVFVAKSPSESHVVTRGPNPWWDDFDTGEVRQDHVTIENDFVPGTYYIIMMIESDDDADFDDTHHHARVVEFQSAIRDKYAQLLGMPSHSMLAALAPTIESAFNALRDDDELLGIGLFDPGVHDGDTRVMSFKGDGSHYELSVRVAGLKAAGICRAGDWGSRLIMDKDLSGFIAESQNLFDDKGLRLIDVTTYVRNGQRRWSGIARSGDWASRFLVDLTFDQFKQKAQQLFDDKGMRLVRLLTYTESGQQRWAGIARSGNWASHLILDRDINGFMAESQKQFDDHGLRLIDVTTHVVNGQRRWSGIARSGNWANRFLVGMSYSAFEQEVAALQDKKGLRASKVLTYVDGGKRLWAGLCRSGDWESRLMRSDSLGAFLSEAQSNFDNDGLRLVNMEIYNAAD